ncbi:DUF2946 family protein [Rubripirellula tenax]|uniref:DUF2946 family protein n=1 Tax=Rubripirellula tenax TaxID=2528015 RepID=UPI0011B4A02E
MTSLVRPILSGMLCCAIVFGQAPVWMHVATCDEHSHADHALTESPDFSCCHHVHGGEESASLVQKGFPSGDSSDEHDSDNCPICQSLASPCGLAWPIQIPRVEGNSSKPVRLPAQSVLTSAFLLTADSRGPPVFA